MEIKLRYRFLIAFTFLFILISLIQDSYAKYLTSAAADTNMSIARWNILVNNQDIINNNDFSNAIIPVFPGSTHIASDIIAPNSEGYFDIIINNTKVDVSFDEIISVTHSLDNTVTDLIITGYSLNNGTVTTVNDTSVTINKTVLLSDTPKTHTFRIYIKWLDNSSETMNNSSDTQATKNGKASMAVNVSFVQKPN